MRHPFLAFIVRRFIGHSTGTDLQVAFRTPEFPAYWRHIQPSAILAVEFIGRQLPSLGFGYGAESVLYELGR